MPENLNLPLTEIYQLLCEDCRAEVKRLLEKKVAGKIVDNALKKQGKR